MAVDMHRVTALSSLGAVLAELEEQSDVEVVVTFRKRDSEEERQNMTVSVNCEQDLLDDLEVLWNAAMDTATGHGGIHAAIATAVRSLRFLPVHPPL